MLITIVTVVYNGEKYLEQTIQSVLGQDYPEIEYIVIDGGSTDGTLAIIERYASRIAHWISEPDHGIADAMNKGVRLSSGQYILFLHADDYLYDHASIRYATERMAEAADLHAFPIFFAVGDRLILRHSRGFNYWLNFKTGFQHQGVFFHRKIFERLGLYDTSFRVGMDYEYFLRAYRAGAAHRLHNHPSISVMRDTGISSKKDWASLRARFLEERRIHYKHRIRPF